MASTRTGTSWPGEEVGAGIQQRSPWARMWGAEVLGLTRGEGLPGAGHRPDSVPRVGAHRLQRRGCGGRPVREEGRAVGRGPKGSGPGVWPWGRGRGPAQKVHLRLLSLDLGGLGAGCRLLRLGCERSVLGAWGRRGGLQEPRLWSRGRKGRERRGEARPLRLGDPGGPGV